MLEVNNISKSYGDYKAVSDMSFKVNKGEVFGLAGPNGAGKTTILKILAGLLKADEGDVKINGIDIFENDDILRDYVGYMPDSFGVYDNLKVIEYMEFYAMAYGIEEKDCKSRSIEVLDYIGFNGLANEYVDSLSRGMKQKLCLARTLINKPQLVVLDEPASGLDPKTRIQFKEIIERMHLDGTTVIISSHILSDLSSMCTSIGIIDRGQMIVCGTMDKIKRDISMKRPLNIRVLSGIDNAVKTLRKSDSVKRISIKDDFIQCIFDGEREEEAALLQALVKNGAMITEYAREEDSLEKLFIKITDTDQ